MTTATNSFAFAHGEVLCASDIPLYKACPLLRISWRGVAVSAHVTGLYASMMLSKSSNSVNFMQKRWIVSRNPQDLLQARIAMPIVQVLGIVSRKRMR